MELIVLNNQQPTPSGTDISTGKNTEEQTESQTGNNTEKDTTVEVSDISTEEVPQDILIRANLSIAFRQLANYKQENNKDITFDFIVLVKKTLEKNHKIIVRVILINETGILQESETEAQCTLNQKIEIVGEEIKQTIFKCIIKGLKENYYSFRFNSSEDVSGIPEDELALDPILTEEAIDKGKIIDYSDPDQAAPPVLFTPTKSEYINCEVDKFSIPGELNGDLKSSITFDVVLIHPENTTLKCEIGDLAKGPTKINCKADREINGKIILEQTLIKDGIDEILIIGGFESPNDMTCSNGKENEAKEKLTTAITFRQISHLVQMKAQNSFTFLLVTLLTQSYQNNELKVNITLTIPGNTKKNNKVKKSEKSEEIATCKIEKESQTNLGNIQGVFKCEVKLDAAKYNRINFTDPYSIKISPNNDKISGISELEEDEASPIATQNKIDNPGETDLDQCIDYSNDMYINTFPPSIQINSINDKECSRKGKLKMTGTFSDGINGELTFFLPLSYPSSQIKCTIKNAKAGEKEFKCKIQKEFYGVQKLIVEQRMIKNKYKEVAFIKKMEINLENIDCFNYNKYKEESSRAKMYAPYSYLHIGGIQKINNRGKFFFAMLKAPTTPPPPPIQYTITIIIISRRNLRQLEQTESEQEVTCYNNTDIQNDPEVSKTIVGVDCQTNNEISGTIGGMQVNTDDLNDIGGMPEGADPSQLDNKIDYSKLENLKEISSLPTVNITSMNGSDCEDYGNYTIEGEVIEGELTDGEYQNVIIPFGFPDSSGLCVVKAKSGKVDVVCQNREKFDYSSISYEPSVIKNVSDIALFKIGSYTNQKKFACDLSVFSELPADNSTTGINSLNKNNKSSGLSGAAIAAIVICLVAAVIIISAIIICIKKGKIKRQEENITENSTINKLPI